MMTKVLADSKGTSTHSSNRQLLSSVTELNKRSGTQVVSVIEDRDVAAELKKVAIRWSEYRFPVRHAPSTEEERYLNMLPRLDELQGAERRAVRDSLLKVYSAEQRR